MVHLLRERWAPGSHPDSPNRDAVRSHPRHLHGRRSARLTTIRVNSISKSSSTRSLTLVALALAGSLLGRVGSPQSAIASELEPQNLIVTRGADTLGVAGDHFALTWDAATGGEVRAIRLHDGAFWHELLATGTRRATVPGLLVTTAQSKQGALGPFGRGELQVLEEGPERVVVQSRSRLAPEKGKPSELELTQTYVVYPEGALFIDFVLELKPGAKPVTIQRAAVGIPLSLTGYTLSFWHWQRAGVRGSGFLEPQPVFTSAYCPNLGLALGAFGNLSNQIQVTLEAERGLGGDLVASAIRDGKTFLHWLHPSRRARLLSRPRIATRIVSEFSSGGIPSTRVSLAIGLRIGSRTRCRE